MLRARVAAFGTALAVMNLAFYLAIDRLPLGTAVAIEFSGLAEGRGYSQAQMLRKRFKFTGELRAVGNIQRDQLFFMARCGFDAFEMPEGANIPEAIAAFDDFTGQQAAKANLKIFVAAARKRGDALDHVLLSGPPGLGKTTLAQILSKEMGVGFRATADDRGDHARRSAQDGGERVQR